LNDNIPELRVLTYNIHHANPPSKINVIDIKAIANVIKQQNPDLVALQEVDVFTNRSGKNLNEAAEIAREVGLPYYFFGKGIDYDGGEYGVAVLSKYPFEKARNNPLPTKESTGGEHRTLATVIVNLPNKKKILFACTHLDAQRTDTNRLLQINRIMELLTPQKKYPIIIAGDFNAVPSSPVIDILDKNFTRSCIANCPFTIPQINPDKTIDYIAYSPSDKFAVVTHKVIDEPYASDHLPVLSVLKFK
jgi:endonuclease/exonuclease/phosphatase family metal-dependent hydrolase